MPQWKPGGNVQPSEIIGRRLFDKSSNAVVDKDAVKPNIFFDSRFEEDLSLDRLGDGQPHRQTLAHLTPLCDDAAVDLTKFFLGWIAAQKKHVKFEEIRPDPLTIEVDGVENPYHALLDRSRAREKAQAFHLSRSLLMSFKESGIIVPPLRKS